MQITVMVKAGTKNASRIASKAQNEWQIDLHERPIDGAANKAVIDLVAKELGIAKSLVSIIRGVKSKHKVIEVLES